MSNAGLSIASQRPMVVAPARRRLAIVVASVAFHAVVLTPMALGLFSEPAALPNIDRPAVFVEMEPRPLLAGETVRTPAPSSAAARERAPTLGETFVPSLRDAARDEDEDAPTAPAPRLGQTPPAGTPAPASDAWRVAPEGMAAAVARSMRTGAGGCRTMDGRLNAGEQALCDERFNEAAGRAGALGPRTLTPSEQRRDAQFARDGAQALAAYESRRAPAAGGVGIVMSSPDCVGGNLRGTCAGALLREEFQFTDDRLRNGRKME